MKRVLRWLGLLLGVVAVILLVVGTAVYFMSNSRLAQTYEIDDEALELDLSASSIKRGRHLVKAIGKCVECHDKDLGGMIMADDPVFGRLVASNLTSGKGGIGEANAAELVKVIRYGIARHDSRSVILMPSQALYFLTDSDLADIITYLQMVPPVDRELPETGLGPLARFLLVQGALPTLLPAETIDQTARRAAPKPGETREYGKYLAVVGGCQDCHKEDLSGGAVPGAPPGTPAAADLRADSPFGEWTKAGFVQAMRKGARPDGSQINTFMPWKFTRDMTDKELTALWLYLKDTKAAN